MKTLFQKFWPALLIAILFNIAAVVIYIKLHPIQLADNLVQGNGRIDGDMINLNAKYPGRIASIAVDEGDRVQQGQIVATIESAEQKAQQCQAAEALEARKKEVAAKRIELQIARKTLPQDLVKAGAALVIKERQMDELSQSIHAQQTLLSQDEMDHARMQNLYDGRLIEKRQLEMSALKLQTDRDQLSALLAKQEQLKQSIDISKSDRLDAQASQQKIAALEEGIAALDASIRSLEASKNQIDAVVEEMKLRSPINGYVIEKVAHAGEVTGSGMSVLTLIDPNTLYLKIFIDTLQNGKVKLGDRAVIFLDAYPDRAIEAKVVRIQQKAEFTPKEVSVPSDRIQRVFAVHLKPLQPDPLLKLGIPAVGVISLDGRNLPTSLREIPQ